MEQLSHGINSAPAVSATAATTTAGEPTRLDDLHRGAGDDWTVLDFVDAQARAHPERIAIEAAGERVTYADLLQRVQSLAAEMLRRGVSPGTIGLHIARSSWLIVALIAILRVRAAYVPLDRSYPPARLKAMALTARPRLLLTDDRTTDLVSPDCGIIDVRAHVVAPTSEPLPRPLLSDLAYVLFTSGSTGDPKGVAMHHGPLANLIRWQLDRSTLAGGERTLQFSPISFDVSFQEIFATLAAGGSLQLITDEDRRDPHRLLDFLIAQQVNRLFLPFIALQHLCEAACTRDEFPTSLREVVTAGEQLQVTPHVIRFFAALPECTLDNQYGPTETHVVTAHRLSGPPDTWPVLPPIGRPIANARTYVLDDARQPVAPGAEGELYLGGTVLAEGYLHRPDLTDERFVPDPFVADGRMYRTGDRVCERPDGELLFLGRIDNQVKIRGFRVEPAEVETVLRGHPDVLSCAVLPEDSAGLARLVAYVVASPFDATSLREYLVTRVPEYMVPSLFVPIDQLPFTASGKLDRRTLANLAVPASSERAPLGAIESQLIEIWESVLGRPGIDLDDQFFELGGHSLLAAQLMTRMEAAFGRRWPMSLLFEAGTVRALADEVRGSNTRLETNLVALTSRGELPPLFFVHALAGTVFDYQPLAAALSPRMPLLGLQVVADEGVPDWAADIGATARVYTQQILQAYPTGPLVIGGWSSGGVVALEMAQQIRATGREVDWLVILDDAPMNTGAERSRWSPTYAAKLARNVPYWLEDDFACVGWRDLSNRLVRRLASLRRQLTARLAGRDSHAEEVGGFVDLGRVSPSQARFMETHYVALQRYTPKPYPGRVLLFTSRTQPLFSVNEPARIWRALGAQLETVELSCTHLTIVESLFASALASHIETRIRATIDPSHAAV